MKDSPKKDDVLKAKIDLHTVLASTYETDQPHYLPENKASVSARLACCASTSGNNVLIDLGCGTGFIINLALPLYNVIFGADITPAMLSKVDVSSEKVTLLQTSTENIPLNDNIANTITANSFLHHLYDIRPTIAEAYRLLKNGGVFCSEEDPNAYFWESMKSLSECSGGVKHSYSDILSRELSSTLKVDKEIETLKGVDAQVVQIAEYQKMIKGGMRSEKIEAIFKEIGFSKVNVEYYWFLGQAKITHQFSSKVSENIESYLRLVLPLSKHLFKYFRVEAWK